MLRHDIFYLELNDMIAVTVFLADAFKARFLQKSGCTGLG